jgi:endonuclease/exonuclease/phosphatase family metal-dependent hydrolase
MSWSLRWKPETLGEPNSAEAPQLLSDEVRVVTLNGWHLLQPDRVPTFLDGAAKAGRLLGVTDESNRVPELLGMQELDSQPVLDELRSRLSSTHDFISFICSSSEPTAEFNSIAAAISREHFEVLSHRCIDLGRIWPDRPRGAVVVKLRPRRGGALVHFASVHLAWHLFNAPNADRLREGLRQAGALDSGRLILVGDSNTWPGAECYRRLTAEPLRDLLPDGPATHFIGKRVDLLLGGSQVEVLRRLNRRNSYELLKPTSRLTFPKASTQDGSSGCPISDHLPEGAVVRFRS